MGLLSAGPVYVGAGMAPARHCPKSVYRRDQRAGVSPALQWVPICRRRAKVRWTGRVEQAVFFRFVSEGPVVGCVTGCLPFRQHRHGHIGAQRKGLV